MAGGPREETLRAESDPKRDRVNEGRERAQEAARKILEKLRGAKLPKLVLPTPTPPVPQAPPSSTPDATQQETTRREERGEKMSDAARARDRKKRKFGL